MSSPSNDPYAGQRGYQKQPGYPQGYPSAAYGAYPPQAYALVDLRPASGMGLTGFVLSLLGMSLLGIFFSIAGMSETKPGGNRSGRGLTVAGLIINIVGLAAGVIAVVVWLALAGLLVGIGVATSGTAGV